MKRSSIIRPTSIGRPQPERLPIMNIGQRPMRGRHPMDAPPHRATKSRSDDTLLTVDAIYGQSDGTPTFPSRTATTLGTSGTCGTGGGAVRTHQVSSLRDLPGMLPFIFRRINSTVNQVLSLRDTSPLTQNLYKLYISYA